MNEANQSEQDTKNAQRYSFLLRLWQTNRSSKTDWHASLENSITGERLGFANLEQLFAFLMSLIERDNKRNSERAQKSEPPATRHDKGAS
jgi:hypothetical protein